MPRQGPALFAVLTVLLANAEGSGSTLRTQRKIEFVKAMDEAAIDSRKADVKARARTNMHKRLMKKAIPIPSSMEGSLPDFLKTDPDAGFQRRAGVIAVPSARKLEDGGGDDDAEEEEGEWSAFGFDPADFSLKYSGCSQIAMYSDENAEDGASVFETKRFVVFRLCSTDSCYDGSSCNSNYGEYLIPLEEYLESMGQFKEEMFEAYCYYCEQCMYFEKYFYNNRKLDDAEDAGDDYVAEEADDAVDEDEEEESHACMYYDECVDYLMSCDYDAWLEEMGYDDDSYAQAEEVDFSDFFECTEFDGNNDDGYVYYIGPRCTDDGLLSFGIYSDEYCSQYVGNSVDISDFTGIDFETDYLNDYSPSDCISCKESDLPYMIVQDDADDGDDITELCENLYTESAKCNKHLYDAEDGSYMSYNQETNEALVCGFISNVNSGKYDEMATLSLMRMNLPLTSPRLALES